MLLLLRRFPFLHHIIRPQVAAKTLWSAWRHYKMEEMKDGG